MASIKLAEIATVITKGTTPTSVGFDFVDDGINFIKIESITEDGCFIPEKFGHITEACHQKLARSILHENDLLFSIAGAIGRTAIVKGSILPANTNQALAIIRIPEGVVDYSYLKYVLESPIITQQFEKKKQGVAQLNISLKDIGDFIIPLPSLTEQKSIVSILSHADTLISLRKQQIAKLDELVKARFVEMFGDPKTNPMDWSIVPIGSIIKSCESGWSGNGVQRMRRPGEIAVLKVSAVTKGYFIPDECKVLDDQENIKKYVFPEKGDLLFSRANTKELVGATAMILEDYPELILPDKLWKLRFFDQGNVYYMKHILSCASIREQFFAASTGTSGSMFNVSMDKFREIQIPLPPIEQQKQFAAFVVQTDQQKLTIQHSLAKMETLKKALMQKYFG